MFFFAQKAKKVQTQQKGNSVFLMTVFLIFAQNWSKIVQ